MRFVGYCEKGISPAAAAAIVSPGTSAPKQRKPLRAPAQAPVPVPPAPFDREQLGLEAVRKGHLANARAVPEPSVRLEPGRAVFSVVGQRQ